jgi:hypothetical protein
MVKNQTNVKVASKSKASVKRGKSSTRFFLEGVSAVQTAGATYSIAKRGKTKGVKIIEGDAEDAIPQTEVPCDGGLTEISGEDLPADFTENELLHERSKRVHYFLDSHKVQAKYWGVMIDTTTNGPLLASNKPCWWCRTTFQTKPIGCPLAYHKKGDGLYKERFKEKLKAANLSTDGPLDFFETEGLFCSFPCCKAYILDRRGSVKYKESASLLVHLYYILFQEHEVIPTAPSWKMLREYGGHLSIQEFRATFGKLEYIETVNMRRPYMFCSSQYISAKRIKLFRGVKDSN